MSSFIDSSDYPRLHSFAEMAELAITSATLTAGFGYILNVTKVIHLTNPWQGGIYGAVAATIVGLAYKLNEKLEEEHGEFKGRGKILRDVGVAVMSSVVATGVTYAAGYPMSYPAGFCLLPISYLAQVILRAARD